MKAKIAIVGASVRAAVQSALRAGYSPVAADLFADADLREACPTTQIANYPAGFCDWLAQQDVDGWFYTGALENYPDLIDQMAVAAGSSTPLWGNIGSVLRQVRSPLQLQQTLSKADLLFPETQTTPPPSGGIWLSKTYRGSSGSGVRRLEPSPEPKDPLFQQPVFQRSVFQRFVEGTPISALFIASRVGATLIGITKQLIDISWTHAKPFQYAGSIGPWNISDHARAEIERTGNVLAQQFKLVGPFGVDMILSEDQVWTLEVNPRYTAAVEVVEVGERTATKPCQSAGKAILFARQQVEVSTAFSDWALERSRIRPWPEIGDVPTPGTLIEANQPVLTVFAQADCVDEVERRLHASISNVETRLYG